ncbi:MAG TPA: hypothetical protein VKY74_24040 [Chloroflexia bacterium]|nr:hypothetical protein [Chloroflexia bacterium]
MREVIIEQTTEVRTAITTEVRTAITTEITVTTKKRRTCQIPREKRRLGGLVRTGKQPSPHDADPAAAQEARRIAFAEHQRQRGARGAAATRISQGPKKLAHILAEYYREHPTSLEIFVAEELDAEEVLYTREFVVEVELDVLYWRLDFLLQGYGPAGADLVIEPGAGYWHDPARDAERYRVLATLGYSHVLTLTDVEIEQKPECARQRIRDFVAGRALAQCPVPQEVSNVHAPLYPAAA